MEKGKIIKLKNLSDDLNQVQDYFIKEAEENTSKYIDAYINHNSSINGRYVCSDLFKETFPLYTKNIESRKKYSSVIHNSAAVLANELFHMDANNPNIEKCIFLTGVPGAGKSFFVQSLAIMGAIDEKTMIYEGDISTKAIIEKIETVKEAGKTISIIVVNPTLELAQRNAINRSYEMGRGASSETMARIISKIPNALNEIHTLFPEIELAIYNKTTNYDIEYYLGWEYAMLLEHGNYEEILTELLRLRIFILEEMQQILKNVMIDNYEDDYYEKGRQKLYK